MTPAPARIPYVDYLVLGDAPYLRVHECIGCGARYFDRRNGCASCFANRFADVPVATTGVVVAFTIVNLAAPGIPVPFVAATIDCHGTTVRADLVNVDPTPDAVTLGMAVHLVTTAIGVDGAGTEAVGFAFEPTLG